MTGGGSEIPSRLHRHPGDRGLRPGMTPSLWVQRRPEQREAAPQAVPAWGYGSVHAESPHPRGLRGGAICGSYRASGSVRRAISVPLCPFGVRPRAPPAFGHPSECSSEGARFVVIGSARRCLPFARALRQWGCGLASRLCRTCGPPCWPRHLRTLRVGTGPSDCLVGYGIPRQT